MKKKAVVLHGKEPLLPSETRFFSLLSRLLEPAGVLTEQRLDSDFLTAENLSRTDLLIPASSVSFSTDQLKILASALEEGLGMAETAGGVERVRDPLLSRDFALLRGAQFITRSGKIRRKLHFFDTRTDPIIQGLEDFELEAPALYFLPDPAVEVLASRTLTEKDFPWLDESSMPAVWKYFYGEGRIFFWGLDLLPGSEPGEEVLEELLRRGTLWAVR